MCRIGPTRAYLITLLEQARPPLSWRTPSKWGIWLDSTVWMWKLWLSGPLDEVLRMEYCVKLKRGWRAW